MEKKSAVDIIMACQEFLLEYAKEHGGLPSQVIKECPLCGKPREGE